MKYLSIMLFFGFHLSLFGQFSLEGLVRNEQNEVLDMAVIYIENTQFAAVTDEKGYYKISDIPPGTYSIKVSHTSYGILRKELRIDQDLSFDFMLKTLIYALDKIEIVSNRIQQNEPFKYTNVSKATLEKNNLGYDLPTLLSSTPSLVVSSDAGTGIGYSSLNIRGSDQTRINVTINGVPVNDAESQNVFWVNMPDLVASTNSIQIQRGVGPSTNGPGAFGGTISINSRDFVQRPYVTLAGSGGSFGTVKGSVALGTGLLNSQYSVDGRFSYIQSDGFIDRASAKLRGLYFSASKIKEKSSLRFQVVSGKEVTYQAWNGVPESRFFGEKTELLNHYNRNKGSIYISSEDSINLFQSDQRYNYYRYKDQVDNYSQTQSQLSYHRLLSSHLIFNSTAFYTYGNGYFEQFKYDDFFVDYGFDLVTDSFGNLIESADLVRRRWLKNHYYGISSDIKGHFTSKDEWQIGLFASNYIGSHYGEIIKTWINTPSNIWTRYYDNEGKKSEVSTYVRYKTPVFTKVSFYADVQFRYVNYSIIGLLEEQNTAHIDHPFSFINPKAGIQYQTNANSHIFVSYAMANREPARSDFVDHLVQSAPKSEQLNNFEFGYQFQKKDLLFQSGIYYMRYKDQLVLNGNLNDVGAPLRINVPNSYRLGWEVEMTKHFLEKWVLQMNVTLSQNKIYDFKETVYDYTNGFDVLEVEKGNTPISYSPNVVGSYLLSHKLVKNFEVSLQGKYVGKQYLDNTGNDDRSLAAFHLHNVLAHYSLPTKFAKETNITLAVNNILNRKYANNGYTYSYIYETLVTENFVFPQAGINFMVGLQMKL
ncbi:MAG: TonB-dependent receptor [Saprospiraceae bacterium]